MTEKDKRIYKAPALEKGLDIIELMADRQSALSMSEIATELGRSKNEIFRMLSVLEQYDYIKKQDGGEKYSITNHLFELGIRIPPTSTLIEFVIPLMRELTSEIEQSCHISVRSDDHFVVIARVENPAPISFSLRVGLIRNLVETGSGYVFLAWMTKSNRTKIFKKLERKLNKKIDSELIESKVKDIRTLGYYTATSTYMDGITDICVPITQGKGNDIIACCTVPYVASTQTPYSIEKTIPIVRETAATITEKVSSYGGF
jgi:DNA-binding IclR family transcriptional regulator